MRLPSDGQAARFGFCNNIPAQGCQTADSHDSDGAIGIGLLGENKNQQGAGWTKYFNSNTGKTIGYKKVWLFVNKLKMNWVPVMKIITSSGVFGYNSAYWTTMKMLNSDSPIGELKDAKYRTFITKRFKSIRICVGKPSDNCVMHTFSKTYGSAQELFQSGYIRDGSLDQEGFEKAFGVKGQRKCGMQVFFMGVQSRK